MTGWVSAWGSLGEPMSDHLEPPEWYDKENDPEEGENEIEEEEENE